MPLKPRKPLFEPLESRHVLASWFASPVGFGAECTKAAPCSLQTALNASAKIKAGDDLTLLKGTYTEGVTRVRIGGTTGNPITVRGEGLWQSRIDLNDPRTVDRIFDITKGDIDFINLEFTNSSTKSRVNQTATPWPTGDANRGSIVVAAFAANVRLINNNINNLNGSGNDARNGGTLYGNIVWNNGFMGPDRPHGHSLYLQNETGTKVVHDNIAFGPFQVGIHAYAQAGFLNNLDIQGNTIFGNEGLLQGIAPNARTILVGGSVPVKNLKLVDNRTYEQGWFTTLDLGVLGGARNESGIVQNNVVPSGQIRELAPWNNLVKSGNQTGPIGNAVYVEPNQFESNRGHITIYNAAKAANVPVNLSFVGLGAPYEIRNVLQLGVVVASGINNGNPVLIPMGPTAVTPALGFAPKIPVVYDGRFGAFVVTSPGSGPITPPSPPIPPTPPAPPPTPPAPPPTPPAPPPSPPQPPAPPASDVLKEVVWNGIKFTLKKNNFLHITKDGKDIVGWPWQGVKDFGVAPDGTLYILKVGPQAQLIKLTKNYKSENGVVEIGVKSFEILADGTLKINK